MKQEYRGFTVGDKIVLNYMDDPQAPVPGTKGTIRFIDDINTLHVNWENGSSLGVILEAGDLISKIN